MITASAQAGMKRARQDGATVNRRSIRGLAVSLALVLLAAGWLALGAGVATSPAVAQSLFEWEREDPATQRRREEEQRRSRSQRRADYCHKLEQRLVQEWRRSKQTRGELPELRAKLREAEGKFQAAENKAERQRCYEQTFFFGRTLRRTPECVELDREVQRARREVNSLRERIDRVARSGRGQNRQDELIAELARYGCGEDYQRQYEARRPSFFSFFDDRGPRFDDRQQQRRAPSDLPFATYRTMCVRQCDGYYFPVSFSTLPSQFSADETQCSDRCAAPTELFVYRNPGEDVEQMVSLDGRPYTSLENAWLYRTKFIDGCSCDAAEYSEAKIAEAQGEQEAGDDLIEPLPGEARSAARSGLESDGEEAAGDGQAGDDGLIIRDAPADDFDPRRR